MEREANLDQLVRLKSAFDTADAEGSGEVNMDDFIAKMGPHLGDKTDPAELTQLFMKIDADCGGTIDWNEFTSYLLKQGAQEAIEEDPFSCQGGPPKGPANSWHHSAVEKIFKCTVMDKVITCGRDGTIRTWASKDLAHSRTVVNGKAWVTDAIYVPQMQRLLFCSNDRAISFYEPTRQGSLELTARLYAGGTLGVPLCLGLSPSKRHSSDANVVFGDSSGAVIMLQPGPYTLPAREMWDTPDRKDYTVVHRSHKDWVTQVQGHGDLGLVSSSLDSSIVIADLESGRVSHRLNVHTQGVSCFVWSSVLATGASGGLQREILLWQTTSSRHTGMLRGHSASISHLLLDEARAQVISMATDKVIKTWDLRTQRCLQTITPHDWPEAQDARPSAMCFDRQDSRLLTAAQRPVAWRQLSAASASAGHSARICAALYNATFDVAVSCDEGGVMCMWDPNTGARKARFTELHGDNLLTTATFDTRQRRLLTASDDGTVKLWNFNSGGLLRQFACPGPPALTTALLFVHDAHRETNEVVAAGWSRKVTVWEDQNTGEPRSFPGHEHDILCLALWPPGTLASGDQSGRITLWHLPSGECRQVMQTPNGEALQKLIFLPSQKPQSAPLLLACTGAGGMQLWSIGAQGGLICTLQLPGGPWSCVNAICCDLRYQHLVAGDADGIMHVWSIAAGIDRSTPEAASASFQQLSSWQATTGAVASLALLDSKQMLLVGDAGGCLGMWTLNGTLIGRFGSQTWDVAEPTTWHDAEEKAKVAVLRQQSELLEQELLESLSATSKTAEGDFGSSKLGSTAGAAAMKALGVHGTPLDRTLSAPRDIFKTLRLHSTARIAAPTRPVRWAEGL